MILFQKLKCQNKSKIIMACLLLFIIVIIIITVIVAKNNSENRSGNVENATGVEEGEIEQPQIMIGGEIYYYFATGFDEKLPENSEYIGAVEKVDNTKVPKNDFEGVQVRKGQKIYKASDNNDKKIYVEYGNDEYAIFSIKQ